MEFKTDALMLKSIDYKDNDKILTLFSLENGRITASIKGVKKAGAKLKFASQPFCFAEYILTEKDGRNTVVQAGLIDSFYNLREDLVKLYAAFTIIETCDCLLYEGINSPKLFLLTINTLKDLCYEDYSEKKLVINFLINAFSYAGYSLNFNNCGLCGNNLENLSENIANNESGENIANNESGENIANNGSDENIANHKNSENIANNGSGENIANNEIYFEIESGIFTCKDCAKGKKVSQTTYKVFNKVYNKNFERKNEDLDGEKRALTLMMMFSNEKINIKNNALKELINL